MKVNVLLTRDNTRVKCEILN